MSRVKGKDTTPEILVRKLLWRQGYRYRLHDKKLPGKPDLVFPGRKKVIFVHGCFWHKHDCKRFSWPETNKEFWQKKINANAERDRRQLQELSDAGWKALVIWECEVKQSNEEIFMKKLISFLD